MIYYLKPYIKLKPILIKESNKMKVYKINKISDLDKFEIKWKALEAGEDMTFFQTFDWNKQLYKQWHKSFYNRLFSDIIIVESSNVIVPCIRQNLSFSIKWLGRKRGIYLLGTGSYSDYLNFVYSDGECIDTFLTEFVDLFGNFKLFFPFVIEHTALDNALNMRASKKTSVSVAVDVTCPIEKFEKRLSKKTRQNIRTAKNRMHRDGIDFKLRVLNGKLDCELANQLCECHLHRALSKNNNNSSVKKRVSSFILKGKIVHDEKKCNIIKDAMCELNNSLTVIVELNGKLAGYLYGFQDGRVIRIVQNCFDEAYSFYSPMFVGAYDYLIQCLENDKIDAVDFTRGNEDYKYKLGGNETILNSYIK